MRRKIELPYTEPPTLTVVKAKLQNAVDDFLRLGVHIVDITQRDEWRAYWTAKRADPSNRKIKKPQRHPSDLTSEYLQIIVEQCSKEMVRHYISVVDNENEDGPCWNITIPKKKELAPIMSMLLVGAHEVKQVYGATPTGKGVYYLTYVEKAHMFAVREEGIMKKWLERCTTDPVFMEVLGNG